MSFDPTLLMRNSMLGDVPGDPMQQSEQVPGGMNPAVGGMDAVSREMQDQISQLQAPSAPPQTAGALQQFFALLGANSGANLLRQPGAATPAHQAVAEELAAPSKYAARKQLDYEKARSLRTQMLLHQYDAAARQKMSEGNHAAAVTLLEKKAALHDEQFPRDQALLHANRVEELEKRAAEARKTKQTIPGKAAGTGGGVGSASNRAELAARYRSALAKAYGDIDRKAREQGLTESDVTVAKGFQQQRLSAEYNALLKGENRPATPPMPALTHQPGPATDKALAAGAAPTAAAPGASPAKQPWNGKGRAGMESGDTKRTLAQRKAYWALGH
jgi:hypothetical protein